MANAKVAPWLMVNAGSLDLGCWVMAVLEAEDISELYSDHLLLTIPWSTVISLLTSTHALFRSVSVEMLSKMGERLVSTPKCLPRSRSTVFLRQ